MKVVPVTYSLGYKRTPELTQQEANYEHDDGI